MKNKLSKDYIDTKICLWEFVAAVFIITKTWKQPKYFSTDKLISIDTMEYYAFT